MGLFSSKKSTKETSTSTSNIDRTTTPVVPDWVLQPTQDLASKISGIGKTDPYSLVAGSNPLLNQAAAVAGGLNSQPWNYDTAADFTRQAGAAAAPSVQAASVLDNLGAYESPYTQRVRDATLAEFDHNAGMTRAQQQLDLANDSTFGGSGGSILRALTEGELSRNRASADANLLDQAFMRAASLSGEDANRRQSASAANAQFAADALQRKLQAGGQLADLASSFGANERANLSTMFDVGQYQRGIDQEQRNAPLTLLDFETSQLGKLPLGLFTGEHTVGTETENSSATSKTKNSPSLLSQAAKAAKIAATVAALSDERLKTNVRRIDTRDDGLGVYEFEYSFAPGETHIGLMAQEVAQMRPDAIIHHPSGFLAVDYGRLA